MLNYEQATYDEIFALCQENILDYSYWNLSDETNEFLVFRYNEDAVAALEYHFIDSYLFIDMLQVVEQYQHKGFGAQIVDMLQTECLEIRCVPIETSERLFKKCGFKKTSNDSRFWVWKA